MEMKNTWLAVTWNARAEPERYQYPKRNWGKYLKDFQTFRKLRAARETNNDMNKKIMAYQSKIRCCRWREARSGYKMGTCFAHDTLINSLEQHATLRDQMFGALGWKTITSGSKTMQGHWVVFPGNLFQLLVS